MAALNTGPAGSTYTDTTSLSEESEDDAREETSILDVLKAPKVAVQNRKRRVLSNPGRGKRRCSSSSTSSEPKRVTPQQRIKEFPGEQLVVHQFFEHNCKNNSISREKRKHNYNILQAFLKRVMLRKSGIIYPTLVPLHSNNVSQIGT